MLAIEKYGPMFFSDPKILLSFIMWAVYMLLLYTRWNSGWRGRRAAFLATFAFVIAIGAWAANYFQPRTQVYCLMNFVLIGVNHQTAPVEVREQFAIPEARLPEAVKALASYPGVEEGDDRLHLQPGGVAGAHRRTVRPTWTASSAQFYGFDPEPYRQHLYEYREQRSGAAPVPRGLEPGLDGGGRAADPGTGEGSLRDGARRGRGELAARCAADAGLRGRQAGAQRNRGGDLGGIDRVGCGRSGEEDLRQPARARAFTWWAPARCANWRRDTCWRTAPKQIYVANRTYERAVALAKKFNGEAIPFEQLYETVPRADIVISSTGAPHAIFRKEHGEQFLRRRRNRPMFFIDIAVPRDVDPEMNKLDGIFVYDIDDLQQVVSSHVADRRVEADRAEAIVAAGGGQVPGAAADARRGADHRLAAGAPGDRAPGGNRSRARPAGRR